MVSEMPELASSFVCYLFNTKRHMPDIWKRMLVLGFWESEDCDMVLKVKSSLFSNIYWKTFYLKAAARVNKLANNFILISLPSCYSKIKTTTVNRSRACVPSSYILV